jgi:hypothetical protein
VISLQPQNLNIGGTTPEALVVLGGTRAAVEDRQFRWNLLLVRLAFVFRLNRRAAPEKVNATSKPNRAKDGSFNRTQATALVIGFFWTTLDAHTSACFQQKQHAEEQNDRENYR